MARRVLIAWELGGGFGHVARLRPFAEQLKADGHACAFAMRNLGVAEQLLDPSLGPLYQAPVRLGDPINPVRTQVSYASLLHNIGFSNPVVSTVASQEVSESPPALGRARLSSPTVPGVLAPGAAAAVPIPLQDGRRYPQVLVCLSGPWSWPGPASALTSVSCDGLPSSPSSFSVAVFPLAS